MCLHCPIMIKHKRICKYTNQYCQRMIILCCFLQSCISMQLLLLCGDIETNPGPTTKVCPECSLSLNIKVSMCPCGYSFKSAKNVTTVCPQCSSLIHIKKSICLCGYTFENSHSDNSSVRALAMRKKWALEISSETNERRAKNRKCTFEKRASESQDLVAIRRELDRISKANKRACI